MAMTFREFLQQRAQGPGVQYFACPGATQTVMVCSHIWWTDQIALAFLRSGYNLVMHPPLYTLYTDPPAWAQFHALWERVVENMHLAKVDYLIGGNTSGMLLHPDTGQMVHEALSRYGQRVTLINWWWDELRARPPLARIAGPETFVKLLGRESCVNAIWDIDVLEEVSAQLRLANRMVHLPLATLPEYWPSTYMPVEERPLAACFLGNCHFTADWIETDSEPWFGWAREIVARKISASQIPMRRLIDEVTAARQLTMPAAPMAENSDAAWQAFGRPMEILNAAYMHYTRNKLVQAAKAHLRGKLALIGKGWESMGLKANMEHARETSGMVYGQSQVSLNLFGGCVHGGMPLRPYDIGASGGLIVTHNQRELPALFEPGKECLVFACAEEMVEQIERVRKSPAEFNAVAQAGRKRVLAEHTWGKRIERLMREIGKGD